MNPSINKTTGPIFPQAFAAFVLTLALALLSAASLHADTLATSQTIRYTGTDFEGRQSFQLEWPALSNATYLMQSATDLAAADAWQTVDLVTPTNGAGILEIKGRSISENSREFFRLILPQPQIFSVEPAVFAPGVTVEAWVIGQSFASSDVVHVDGAVAGSYVDAGSFALTLPTPSAGPHLIELLRDGAVVSSFTVTCTDALVNPELVLQGPPTEPPASPSKKDFRGHVTLLKAFDDGSEDSAKYTKTGHVTLMKAFDDDSAAARPRTKTGHVTLMKAFDDEGGDVAAKKDFKGHVTLLKGFDDGSEVTFDIQEGKKGLNAVNVKLARSSGEVQQQVVDLAVEGRGLDFVWARTYHSRLGRFDASANGWTFAYDVHCAQNSSGGIDVYDGTGRKDTFTLQTDGTYSCPELFREVTFSATVVRVTFADTGYWEFNPLGGSVAAGKLHRVITRNGDTMTLGYDASSGQLTQIVDDLDRTNTVAYTSDGHVASVTDFTGRSVTYQYYQGVKGDNGGAGDLKSVTSPPFTGTPNGNDFPDGKTTTYTYSQGS